MYDNVGSLWQVQDNNKMEMEGNGKQGYKKSQVVHIQMGHVFTCFHVHFGLPLK